ncbi:MAG: hypothetical protein AAFU79_00905 [Myxococcota bacterium]
MRLSRLARTASLAALGMGLALPLLTGIAVVRAPSEVLFSSLGFSSLVHIAPWQERLGRALALLPVACASLSLLLLGRGLRRVAAAAPSETGRFSVQLTSALARFAIWVALASGASILVPLLTGLVLSVGAPAGQGRLVLQIGSSAGFGLVASLAVLTLARLLAEARRLEAENAEFV